MSLPRLLDELERAYGALRSPEPTSSYEMVLWMNCGYPPSEERCRRGFAEVSRTIGTAPKPILAASQAALVRALRAGGSFPELRAARLKKIARVVAEEHGGDLDAALRGPEARSRKVLKRFPTIGDPGADKILLFTGRTLCPAVPSNCVHVPLRLGIGVEAAGYAASYRSIREAFAAQLPADRAALERAYLLIKHHGQVCCKRSAPLCARCPVASLCPYFKAARKAGKPPRKPA